MEQPSEDAEHVGSIFEDMERKKREEKKKNLAS